MDVPTEADKWLPSVVSCLLVAVRALGARAHADPESKLGIRELVKELRESDIDGAPLLFNAAASRGEHSCFKTACDLIHKTLGKGGLVE